MEIPLKKLNSGKSGSSSSRRISITDVLESTGTSERQDVPVHLFLSPTHSESPLSTSSNSSNAREKRRKKAFQDTSFTNISDSTSEAKHLTRTLKDVSEKFDHQTSSGTDETSTPSSRSIRKINESRKPVPKARISKIRESKIRSEHEMTEIEDFDLKNEKFLLTQDAEDDASLDIESRKSFTPSENLSFREKIRDRFNAVKERAAESLTRPHSRPQSRLKMIAARQTDARMDDLLKSESEINAAMKQHANARSLWRDAQEIIDVHNYEEADKFFTEIFEEEKPLLDVSQAEDNSDDSKEIDSTSKIFASDFLGIREDWEICEFKKPVSKDESKNDRNEKEKIFFCPSVKPVLLEEKLEPGVNARYVEEEGIYVEKKIVIPNRIKNKMERRLLKDPNGRKWFEVDGELINSTNPLKSIRMRVSNEIEDEQKQSLTVFKPATMSDLKCRYIDIAGIMHYILDVDISLIQFTHHPLFSREHVLAQRLKELFIKYKRRNEAKNLIRCKGRLEALRKARDNLKNIIEENGNDASLNEKLQRYEDDIKEVRRIRNIEGQIEKKLLNKMLMTWQDVKNMREVQGYQNTDIKLNVKNIPSNDVAAEKEAWDQEIKREAREIYDERKKEYDRKFAVYKAKNDEWIRSKRKKLQDDKRRLEKQDAKDRESEESSDAESMENSGSDSEVSIKEELMPPKPIVLADIINEVTETFSECFRQPGQPELELTISISDSHDCSVNNSKEDQRRTAMKRQFIFLRLFYNGKEVCCSKPQPLSQKFNVLISQRFAIRILELPESFMIEIYESSGSFSKNLLVPGIYLPFPSSFTTVENSDIQKHEFSSDISVSYNHTGVGSGSNIIPYAEASDYNNRPVCLYTSGTIAYRMGWAENHGQILAPPEKYWMRRRDDINISLTEILGTSGVFDLKKLKEWSEKSKLDPNDPQNSVFFHFLQQAKDCEKLDTPYFRLDPLQREFDFCEESEIMNNTRLKLLNLRDAGELEFRGIRMVPLSEKQIHKDTFKMYERRLSKPQQSIEVTYSDPLENHRSWGKKYLEQVQQRILKECRLAGQHKKFSDIVSEESVPDLGTLGLTFMKWLRPKRPLRPVRKERKRITPQNLTGQDIKIIVNVIRAFEVPIRKDVDGLTLSGSLEGISLINVRPFVEISFQGVKARTTAADGANPTWNQDLQIPLHIKKGDFSPVSNVLHLMYTILYFPDSLQSIKDTLYLHLFDEIVIDLIDDETERETSIHQRFERHWLASMQIPFSTLYFNSRIEGTFKLYSPPVLLGYEREAHRRQFCGSSGQESLLPQRDATYITLFVTVQPPLNAPNLLKEKLESSEALHLEKHLEEWEKQIMSMYPHRKVKTLVIDITGKTVCVTRFIKPLRPPQITEDNDITPEMVARFVAMIPSIGGSTFFPGLFDIWLTGDQVLRLLSGDSEDHALLLCSYFLHLGLKAYVLLGSGIPHGSSAYVLVKEDLNKSSEYYVWDATNGQKYDIKDSFCPLKKIYSIFNDQNIWANIQPEEMPRRTRLDLTKRSDWFPAFGKNIGAPLGTIQPDGLEYRTTSRQAVEILQDKMETRLRDNIMKWRKKRTTRWNRYCSGILRRILPKLEKSVWNTKESQTPDHILELQHILASHKMCGFPINMAYTDMSAAVEAVKATGVHCNASDQVEFALSVYIHPYPNDVLSVWIYVAALERRR